MIFWVHSYITVRYQFFLLRLFRAFVHCVLRSVCPFPSLTHARKSFVRCVRHNGICTYQLLGVSIKGTSAASVVLQGIPRHDWDRFFFENACAFCVCFLRGGSSSSSSSSSGSSSSSSSSSILSSQAIGSFLDSTRKQALPNVIYHGKIL